jgi:hypothetical protein
LYHTPEVVIHDSAGTIGSGSRGIGSVQPDRRSRPTRIRTIFVRVRI